MKITKKKMFGVMIDKRFGRVLCASGFAIFGVVVIGVFVGLLVGWLLLNYYLWSLTSVSYETQQLFSVCTLIGIPILLVGFFAAYFDTCKDKWK